MHADAYRLGSRAEIDDLDLDADLDSSVTVVEWGEGLVEDLAPGHLEIKISMPRTAAARTPAADGEIDASETPDEDRAVRLIGSGDRWLAQAESASLALLSGPDAL